jgi:tetratricopeptide (TPR) repeat protein
MRVVGHAPRNLPFTVVLAEGQDSIDHMEEIVYTYPPFAEALERPLDLQFGRIGVEDIDAVLTDLPQLRARLAAAIVGLARSARAAGLAVTPTLVAFETIWLQTTERFPELLERPEMAYMSPLTRMDWGPGFNAYRRGWSDRLEAMEAILAETLDLQRGLVVGLHRAGVPLMTGTDAPLTFVYPGFSMHRELAHLVDCGLTPYDALRAATVVPASELGVLDRSGTIAVGKRADLVLVEGNPLDDVANASRIAGVVVRGRYLPRSALDGMLEELAASYAALDENVALLAPHLETGDAAALVATYRGLAQPQPELDGFVERGLNEMGYERLGADAERAIEIFRLSIDLFPEAANPWDSLGEGLLYLGDFDESLASYERSLELDPGNDNARSRIEWVRVALDSLESPPAVPDASLRLFAGDYGDRHVRYDEGSLYYRRGEGAERRLYPVGADTFGLEGLGMFRLQFVLRRDGAPLKVVGHYHDGRRDDSPRD